MEMLKKMFNSKKFWYTVIGIFIPLLSDTLGLTPAEVEKFVYAIVALIIGQGIADSGK